MYPQPTLIIALASPGLVNLGLPLFKGTLEDQACVFALVGNAQIVTATFFQSKRAMKQCFHGFLCLLEMRMNNWHLLMRW